MCLRLYCRPNHGVRQTHLNMPSPLQLTQPLGMTQLNNMLPFMCVLYHSMSPQCAPLLLHYIHHLPALVESQPGDHNLGFNYIQAEVLWPTSFQIRCCPNCCCPDHHLSMHFIQLHSVSPILGMRSWDPGSVGKSKKKSAQIFIKDTCLQ